MRAKNQKTAKTAKLPTPSVSAEKCYDDTEPIVVSLTNGNYAVTLQTDEVADIKAIRQDFKTVHGEKMEIIKVNIANNADNIKTLENQLALLKMKDKNDRLMLTLLANSEQSMVDGYIVRIAAGYGYPVGSYDQIKLNEDGTKFLIVPAKAEA